MPEGAGYITGGFLDLDDTDERSNELESMGQQYWYALPYGLSSQKGPGVPCRISVPIYQSYNDLLKIQARELAQRTDPKTRPANLARKTIFAVWNLYVIIYK